MNLKLYKAFDHEMTQARSLFTAKEYETCFSHLERAHVLGQRYLLSHLQSHWWMLRVGLARCDRREIVGQILRLLGSVPGSLLGMAPKGNTGGANVSAYAPMDIPEDLQQFLGYR